MTKDNSEVEVSLDGLSPTERLVIIAEWLERGGDAIKDKGIGGFDMDMWQLERSCGTICCIGGSVAMFFPDVYRHFMATDPEALEHVSPAGKALGLTEEQEQDLFFEYESPDDNPVTAEDAAKVIRHLIATGEVDWEIIQ